MFPQITMTKILGNAPYIYKFCHECGLISTLDQLLPPTRVPAAPASFGELVALLVVNRLTCPRPLYQVAEWARNSGFDKYFACSADYLNDDRLGRMLDTIAPYLPELQEALVLQLVTKYDLDPAFIHYDLTSIYFEGDHTGEDWITLGYSRDQKPDHAQLTLGLNVTDSESFPVQWQVYPGNTADVTTVIANMEALKQRFPKASLLHIGDRALFSLEIYRKALDFEIGLLAPLKTCNATKELLAGVSITELPLETSKKGSKTVDYRLGEFSVDLDPQHQLPPLRAIVVWSRAQARSQTRNHDRKITLRREGLSQLQQKLNQPYYRTKPRVEKALARIMKADPVNEGFHVQLAGTEGQLTWQVTEDPTVWAAQVRTLGCYVLVTTVSPERLDTLAVFEAYKRQWRVESPFRTLKHPLKVRPLFLQRPERIRSLLFIIMVALMRYTLLGVLLQRQGHHLTPQRLFQVLLGLVLVQQVLPDRSIWLQVGPPSETELPYLRALQLETTSEWVQLKIQKHYRNLEVPSNPP